MSRTIAFGRYKHSIRTAYNSLGMKDVVSDASLEFPEFADIENLGPNQLVHAMIESIRHRLTAVDAALLANFLETPRTRTVYLHNSEITIPLLNKQGIDWYESSSILNFDFIVETFIGMHVDAKTIYDIGGHQGIWSAYYSRICGDDGRVYCFEPSIINFEISCLLFLVNNIINVINIPFGIGESSGIVRRESDGGMLVDFVKHNLGILRFDQQFFEPADFIKIDIEGFEYEFMRAFPQIFNFCRNMHIEIHIPHLEARGISYLEIMQTIPFDLVKVRNYQDLKLTEVKAGDKLSGFCSLMISKV